MSPPRGSELAPCHRGRVPINNPPPESNEETSDTPKLQDTVLFLLDYVLGKL